MNPTQICHAFEQARASGMRAKDAAQSLGLSEGEAVAAHSDTPNDAMQATALRGPWVSLLQAVEACGPVMALTRNASTVHEKTGVMHNVSGNERMGLALGESIDLRLFFHRWHAGFAVRDGQQHSLQFFDIYGTAVHKLFARKSTQMAPWHALVQRFTATEPPPAFRAALPAGPASAKPPTDRADLLADWHAMKDTHEFFGLLQRHELARQDAFRMVEGVYCERLAPESLRRLLVEAAIDHTAIMCFVGNPGCIQIHSGPIRRVEPMTSGAAQWLNILDSDFNLHLREDLMTDLWLVRKPTDDGTVTSVEAFDASGELMAMFFGARKPGRPELKTWRDLVRGLPLLDPVTPTGACA